jgi:hypothetical protein
MKAQIFCSTISHDWQKQILANRNVLACILTLIVLAALLLPGTHSNALTFSARHFILDNNPWPAPGTAIIF